MKIVLTILLNNILPIFLLVALGILYGRKFSPDMNTLTKINLYMLVPIFTFVYLYTSYIPMDMLKVLAFAVIMMAVGFTLAFVVSGMMKFDQGKRYAFINSIIFYNSGNIGVPLITLVFSSAPFITGGKTPYLEPLSLHSCHTEYCHQFYRLFQCRQGKDGLAPVFEKHPESAHHICGAPGLSAEARAPRPDTTAFVACPRLHEKCPGGSGTAYTGRADIPYEIDFGKQRSHPVFIHASDLRTGDRFRDNPPAGIGGNHRAGGDDLVGCTYCCQYSPDRGGIR